MTRAKCLNPQEGNNSRLGQQLMLLTFVTHLPVLNRTHYE
jgi:hypothetical protein